MAIFNSYVTNYQKMYYTHLPFHLCLARRPWLIGDLSAPQRATPATAGQRSSVRLEPLKGGKKGVNLR